MARFILKWRYIKTGATQHSTNLVKYIATREGVEKCDESWKNQPATNEQQRLIKELVKDFPDSVQSFEYQDYLESQTKSTASGFIGRTIYPAVYKLCKSKENTVSIIGFFVSAASSLVLCFSGIGIIPAVLCMSLIYAAVSMINTSILSIYPLQFLKTGNVASVSGVMDFATYLGAGVSGVIYGALIKNFGYTPMFLSWVCISLISIILVKKIKTTE